MVFSASSVAPGAAHGGREQSGECRELGEAKRLQATYRGAEAQRFAQEPPPYGADWPEVADEADVIFAHVSEPHEACPQFYLSGRQSAEKALGGVAREVVTRDVMTLDEFFAGQEASGAVFEPLPGAVGAVGAAELRVLNGQIAFRLPG